MSDDLERRMRDVEEQQRVEADVHVRFMEKVDRIDLRGECHGRQLDALKIDVAERKGFERALNKSWVVVSGLVTAAVIGTWQFLKDGS